MTTVVNNPGSTSPDNSGVAGTLVALAVILIVAILFFVYGLPAIRQSTSTATIPNQVDVNVTSSPNTIQTTPSPAPSTTNPPSNPVIQLFTGSPAPQTTQTPTSGSPYPAVTSFPSPSTMPNSY